MAVWKKFAVGLTEWAPGVSLKAAYRAAARGDLMVARLGAGRGSLYLCRRFVDDWMLRSAGFNKAAIEQFIASENTAEKADTILHEIVNKDSARCA